MTPAGRFRPPLALGVVLALAAPGCGSGSGSGDERAGDAPPPAADRPATVPIREFKYVPPSVTVRSGAEVTFVNEDEAPHTATVPDGGFDTGTLEQGRRGKVRVTAPGTYKYICELHPYMKGTIVAR